MSFANKVVIVTGGASGIGAATALLFTKEGATVVLVDKNKEKLEETVEKCAKVLNKPYAITANVSKDDDVANIVKEVIKIFGKIDVLVNNAGILRKGLILDGLMATYDELMNVNLRSVVQMTVACAPHLIETKGCIVNVSSSASVKVPVQKYAIYSLSKTGVDHFTRCAANQLASSGVRVNAVNPGSVKTDLFVNAGTPVPWNAMGEVAPLKRLSDPEEIADIIVFLASDRAKSVTGSCYLIDNGVSLDKNVC